MPECIIKARPYVISMKFNVHAFVFLHQNNDYHGPDATNKAEAILGKYATYPTYYQFHTKIENCQETISQSRDECFYGKLHQLLMKQAGCTIPWLPDKSNICMNSTTGQFVRNLYGSSNMNTEENCTMTCTTSETFFYPPTIEPYWYGNTSGAIKIFFREQIKYSKEYYIQNELLVFANIGGLLGLMLGLSLLNLRDLINSLLGYCEFRK